jgi:hypothetical protein
MNEGIAKAPTAPAAWSSSLGEQLLVVARARRAQLEVALAVLIYLGFACYLTWPLITDLTHSIYGAPGDPYGTMAFYSVIVHGHYDPFLPGTISQFAAPGGLTIPWPRDLASAPGTLALYTLTALFGAIPAYGIYTLIGYTLTGLAAFLFARLLTSNTWAALISGWVFAFYPFAAINGQGHIDFVQGWLFVLALWRCVELMWLPTRRNGIFAGLAVILCMWWSPYFILFGGLMYVVVTVVALILAWRSGSLRSTLVPQLIAGVIVIVFMTGLLALTTISTAGGIGVRTHNARELNVYAARPLEYLLPDIQNPLFGSDTRGYLHTLPLHGTGIETTLYVGVTVILLAIVALIATVRRKLSPRIGSVVLALFSIAVVAAITSLQPEVSIFGTKIPFPSHFITQVTTTWRVYSRFVIVVMLALAPLVAVGLTTITAGRSRRVSIAVMSLATILIPLDLWAPQGGHIDKIPTPGIYKTLARQPAGLVAEYPLAAASFNTYSDIFYQGTYDKPMINGYQEDSYQERMALSLAVLSNPSTAGRLAALGVRYVILDASPASWGWPLAGKPGEGFRLIAHEPYASLYLVTAHPQVPALAAAGEGFGETELTPAGAVSWLEKPSGTINLVGTCNSCNGVLSISVAPYGAPRQVSVLDNRGHVLAKGTVTSTATVKIPLHFSKHTTLTVTATPGPQPVSEVQGAPRVSIEVGDLEFSGAHVVSSPSPAPSEAKSK